LRRRDYHRRGGIAYWLANIRSWKLNTQITSKDIPAYRAFTFNELWEILPLYLDLKDEFWFLEMHKKRGCTEIGYFQVGETLPDSIIELDNNILHEAAAELVLWCIEEGYYDPHS
jgi:hypothetical protein